MVNSIPFRIVQTLGTSKQVTFITGFSNFVNAQVCHFHLSGLQEIITYISVSNTPANGSLGGQLQPLTLFQIILTLDESKQITYITATFRNLYEVRGLFPWELSTKTVISCVLNVEKIWRSTLINLSSTLKFYRRYFYTQQYPPRNQPVKSTPIWCK